ncbi:atp-dependent dna helicase [Fusarium beomiforme]|uniref:Atp-dependent dna helicase n=1 Tax=Fusarium beomiforme TaxID=44412 RepID=A0A9P5E1C9_9HYPO|nr:atp-dependent dna helicase [Fusarium beomiforme]
MTNKKRFTGSNINVHAIENPSSAEWNIRLSGQNMINLMSGHCPRDMDDKWMCVTTGPAEQGLIRVRFCRSWSSREIIALIGRVGSDDEAIIAEEGGEILAIMWPTPEEGDYDPWDEESAKQFAAGFCRHLMNCELEA